MARYSDIKYIRSSVNFTFISSVGDIKNKGEVTVKWNLVLKHLDDLDSLFLVRAVLNNKEKADLASQDVLNKFRTIYSWRRGDSQAVPSEFTDVFKWDDNSDNNLHNLNVTNDADWTEGKFRNVLRRIASGEQGLLYKIYGYSRRMNRAATPIGFFCDNTNIVALSQRNQVINDKWYSECGQVWKAGSGALTSGEKFVRVAVDMNRDLGERPKKCRRVWASTNKGRIVLFDYWTGNILWHRVVSSGLPLYAIAYDANNNLFLYYDGYGNIVALKEDTSTGSVVTVKSAGPFGDFPVGNGGEKREMGAVCVSQRDGDGSRFVDSFLYVIANRETIVKFKVTASNITKVKTIPRTHFGCTSKIGDIKVNPNSMVLGETPANQNNIYGIGGGANGQVWVNGHTPITVMKSDVKESGNPVKVKVRLARGNKKWFANKVADKDQWNNKRGCANLWNVGEMNTLWSKISTDQGVASAKDAEWYLTPATKCVISRSVKKGNASDDFLQKTWNYSANIEGEERPNKSHPLPHGVACRFGVNMNAGLTWIKSLINTYDYNGNKIDKRVLGAGTEINSNSFAWLGDLSLDGAPSNRPDIINRIHMELVSIEDGPIPYIDRSFLQDLNYVYGCVDGENYADSNGQIEDLESPADTAATHNYRHKIRSAPSTSNDYFDSMTKWNNGNGNSASATIYGGQFGFAGKPRTLVKNSNGSSAYESTTSDNMKTLDKNVGKPHTLDVYDINQNWRFRNLFENGYFDLSKYNDHLPMSIGSIYPRLPADGRMFIPKNANNLPSATHENNALGYELMFADRREGKVAYLTYSRMAAAVAPTAYPSTKDDRRVSYTDNTAANVKAVDADREYYCATGSTKDAFLGTAPYHVVVDSDNNVWYASQRGIAKMQMLTDANGRNDRYRYDISAGSGLYAFENNNRLFESSLVLMEKHAQKCAYLSAQANKVLFPDGIKNAENGFSSGAYNLASELLDEGRLTISTSARANSAYVYNYTPWMKNGDNGGVWNVNNVYHGDGSAIWQWVYMKESNPNHTGDAAYDGNLDNEYNSDNFGLNCLNQLNLVEVGPDIIHPKILKPTAKTKITKAFSTSHDDKCDTFDSSAFWDSKTSIFNGAQTASGYDDLDTTHYIYDIETNYRHLIYHRYEYHDRTVIGANIDGYLTKRYLFEYDENYDLINLEDVIDNSPEIVWHTPNYVALIPPYDSLDELSANDPHAKNNQYWVDLYLDYVPSVYNLWLKEEDGQYEFVQVGHHDIHVFERWPTPDFCVRGIGNTESVDKITDYDLMGTYYWGECVNDDKCINNGNS